MISAIFEHRLGDHLVGDIGHLDRLGINMTEPTAEQAAHSGVSIEGPFKPDHHRY